MSAILEEWFDGTLAAWATGGGASIVTVDNDEKLRLNTSGAYAFRDFAAPAAGKLIVESDLYYDATGGLEALLELIDTSGPTVLAAVRVAGGLAYVSTDTVGENSHVFATGDYRQFTMMVDQDAGVVRFYISGADDQGRNGTWDQIAAVAYSGANPDRVSFRTTAAGTVYADMVKVFVPDLFIMGDSIADGKSSWSEQPNFASGVAGGRTGPNENELASPAYQLSLLEGERVAGRAFGAATSTQLINGVGTGEGLQGLVLDQGAERLVVSIGHNDLYPADGLATLKANIATISDTVLTAGMAADGLTLCKIAPSDLFEGTPAGDEDNRIEYNRWLTDFCAQWGHRVAFNAEALNDDTKTSVYKRLDPAYDISDGTHLNQAGVTVLAKAMHHAEVPGGVMRSAEEGLFPTGYLELTAPLVKDSRYTVVATPGTLAKGLAQRVRTQAAPKALAVGYAIQPRKALGLGYGVRAAALRSLVDRYAVATPVSAATRPDTYAVRAPSGVTRALRHAVRATAGVTRAAGYAVAEMTTPVSLQRSGRYAVRRPGAMGRAARYVLTGQTTPVGVQKTVAYVVPYAGQPHISVRVGPEGHGARALSETHTVTVTP